MSIATSLNNATAVHTNQPLIPLTIYTLTDSCESRLPPAHRLCEIAWRLTATQEAAGMKKKPSVCIAIPSITLSITPSELSETVQDCFERMQDEMIAKWLKGIIATNSAFNYLSTKIPLALTIPYGITEIYEREEKKGKLSSDSVKLWFEECLAIPLAETLLTKKPDTSDPEMLEKLTRYKTVIASLTSHKTVLQRAQAENLQRAINKAIDGRIKQQLSKILDKFINPASVEELEELV